MSIPRWLPLAIIGIVALGLRIWDLPRRPMHADEANQAVKAGALLEGSGYQFDPHDHHGPTLYFAAVPFAWVRGERSLSELTETTVRLVPALFGTLAVVLLCILSPPSRRAPGSESAVPLQAGGDGAGCSGCLWILAAAFLAVSPPAVYYARYFIQETLLVAFTLMALAAGQRWWTSGKAGWAVTAGIAVGLMLATKESALLMLFAAGAAAVVVRPAAPRTTRVTRDVLFGCAAAAGTAALFYSSFGSNPAGVRDALVAPWAGLQRASGATGHEKPWWYYLQLLTCVRSGGLVWEQLLFFTLAIVGALAGVLRRCAWLRAAGVYALAMLAAISIVPYKTPWNVVHVIPALALLAAAGAVEFARFRRGRSVAVVLAVLTLFLLARHTWRAAFVRGADWRNPWAYVHSSPDVVKFRPIVEAALAGTPGEPVRIIGEEYWPLPWYLRGLPRVGYWTTPPADCDGALVVTTAQQAELVRSRLTRAYDERLLGLRPGVIVVVFTRRTLP